MLDFTLDFLSESEIYDNAFAMARANGRVKDVLAIPFESGAATSPSSRCGAWCERAGAGRASPVANCFRQKFRRGAPLNDLQAAERIRETSTTVGTGTYTLAGAPTGYQPVSSIGANNYGPYFATDGTNWEVGIGQYLAGPIG
jgi:hypothetical protein